MRVTQAEVIDLGNEVAELLNNYLKMAQAKQISVAYPLGEYVYNIYDGLGIRTPNSTGGLAAKVAGTTGATIQTFNILNSMKKTLRFVTCVISGQPTYWV